MDGMPATNLLISHFTFLIIIVDAFDVQYIVTPNQYFAKIACEYSWK